MFVTFLDILYLFYLADDKGEATLAFLIGGFAVEHT